MCFPFLISCCSCPFHFINICYIMQVMIFNIKIVLYHCFYSKLKIITPIGKTVKNKNLTSYSSLYILNNKWNLWYWFWIYTFEKAKVDNLLRKIRKYFFANDPRIHTNTCLGLTDPVSKLPKLSVIRKGNPNGKHQNRIYKNLMFLKMFSNGTKI